MVFEHVTVLFGDIPLQLLDALVTEFDDVASLQANHVIMVAAVGKLENCRRAFEIMAADEPGLLELRQYAVNRRKPQLFTILQQQSVDPFGAEVSILARLQNLEHFESRGSDLQADVAQVLSFHVFITMLVVSFHPTMTLKPTVRSPLRLGIGLTVLGLSLSACIYRMDIQQGNLLEEDTINQVEVGMSRSAVEFLLGTPMIADSFHEGRWDYPYYYKRGRSNEVVQRWIIVYFEGDQVSRIERDAILTPTS